MIKMIKKYLEKRKAGLDEETSSIARVGATNCCATCQLWALTNSLVYGWGTEDDPDGIGRCGPKDMLKYGGDWCPEFEGKEEEGTDG